MGIRQNFIDYLIYISSRYPEECRTVILHLQVHTRFLHFCLLISLVDEKAVCLVNGRTCIYVMYVRVRRRHGSYLRASFRLNEKLFISISARTFLINIHNKIQSKCALILFNGMTRSMQWRLCNRTWQESWKFPGIGMPRN